MPYHTDLSAVSRALGGAERASVLSPAWAHLKIFPLHGTRR